MNERQQNFIGIDVSKLWFDASLLVIKSVKKVTIETVKFDNNPTGMETFEKWLKTFKVSFDKNTLIVMENTGIYHRHLWAFCGDKNISLYIGYAADIKWSFGIARGKNDKVDSIRLCNYAHKHF
jgi:transposase